LIVYWKFFLFFPKSMNDICLIASIGASNRMYNFFYTK